MQADVRRNVTPPSTSAPFPLSQAAMPAMPVPPMLAAPPPLNMPTFNLVNTSTLGNILNQISTFSTPPPNVPSPVQPPPNMAVMAQVSHSHAINQMANVGWSQSGFNMMSTPSGTFSMANATTRSFEQQARLEEAAKNRENQTQQQMDFSAGKPPSLSIPPLMSSITTAPVRENILPQAQQQFQLNQPHQLRLPLMSSAPPMHSNIIQGQGQLQNVGFVPRPTFDDNS